MAALMTTGDNLATTWTLGAAAILTTSGRFILRCRYSHLQWDDLFNGLALACLIVFYILFSILLSTDDPYLEWRLILGNTMLSWSTLYLVKAAFLALSWSIFKISPTFRRAWWIVAVYTFLAFWPAILMQLWECGSPSQYDNPDVCNKVTESGDISRVETPVDLSLHISSDLMIIALPLVFISKLQMSTAQKLGAAGVFIVAFVDILTGLLRNAAAEHRDVNQSSFVDLSILDFMQLFEPGLAVIVCALPAYRVLLPKSSPRKSTPMHQNGASVGMATLRSKPLPALPVSETGSFIRGPGRVDMV